MVEGLAELAGPTGPAGLAEAPLWMPEGDPFGAAWETAGGVTTAPTEGDGTALAVGEILGSGALGAGLAASTGPGASSERASSAQEIHRLSARTRPNEATLAPSHPPVPARDAVLSLLYAEIEVFIHLLPMPVLVELKSISTRLAALRRRVEKAALSAGTSDE